MTSVIGKDALIARVTTARPLSDEARAAIVEKLSKEVGNPLQLVERITPSAIGGVRIQCGDYLYDGTVAKQLKDMKSALIASTEKGE